MLDFAATRIGGKFLDKAIDWGLAAVRGPEQERAARKVFVDAARSALADLGEDSITDESIAQAVATHFSDLVSEPGVALPLFNAAFNRTAPDRERIVKAIAETGLEVSRFPFEPADFVEKLALSLGQRVYGEVRLQGNPLFEWGVNDKLDNIQERFIRLESGLAGMHRAALWASSSRRWNLTLWSPLRQMRPSKGSCSLRA